MVGRWLVLAPILAWAVSAPYAVAQSKSTSKAAAQKKEAASALKQQVKDLIAEADALASKDPERGYDLLRRALDLLADQSALPGGDRLDLAERVESRMQKMREQMTAQKAKAESQSAKADSQSAKPAAKKQLQVSPFFVSSSNAAVTPVVSGDRRFVRVGIRGTFGMITPTGPMVPVQIPVPQFLYGPGRGFTAGPPEKVFQMFFPSPKFTIFRIGSTVTVPDGGLASLGGFRSSMSARNEFGVPVLGKIPYLGRGFRNVSGAGWDVSTVSLGVSARIISMHEEEERFLASGR